ncbi:MAG: putative membrane protein [Kiritimatiellia bacterium]|jgi:uncharacterized membrane protein
MLHVEEICTNLAIVLMAVGVLVIMLGGVKTLIGYAVYEFRHLFSLKNELALDELRSNFGAYLLLGLEFSVAADIIATFVEPTQEKLIALVVLVIIRTLISYFIGKERIEVRQEFAEVNHEEML